MTNHPFHGFHETCHCHQVIFVQEQSVVLYVNLQFSSHILIIEFRKLTILYKIIFGFLLFNYCWTYPYNNNNNTVIIKRGTKWIILLYGHTTWPLFYTFNVIFWQDKFSVMKCSFNFITLLLNYFIFYQLKVPFEY